MKFYTLSVWLCMLAATSSVAEVSSTEILERAREHGALNTLDLVAQLRLVTTSREGQEKEQVVTTSAKRIEGRVHTLARFSKPASLMGVAILATEGPSGQTEEISLYLPRLKRVRKVAASERNKSFMDTDFSYSDFGISTSSLVQPQKKLDEKLEGRAVYVLHGVGAESSDYGEVTLYVDQQTFVPLKAEFRDKKGQPFKRFQASKLKKFKQRVIASESTMENLKTGSKTKVEILSLEESKMVDEDFTERALERG